MSNSAKTMAKEATGMSGRALDRAARRQADVRQLSNQWQLNDDLKHRVIYAALGFADGRQAAR